MGQGDLRVHVVHDLFHPFFVFFELSVFLVILWRAGLMHKAIVVHTHVANSNRGCKDETYTHLLRRKLEKLRSADFS